jgi:hypothetical protein
VESVSTWLEGATNEAEAEEAAEMIQDEAAAHHPEERVEVWGGEGEEGIRAVPSMADVVRDPLCKIVIIMIPSNSNIHHQATIMS